MTWLAFAGIALVVTICLFVVLLYAALHSRSGLAVASTFIAFGIVWCSAVVWHRDYSASVSSSVSEQVESVTPPSESPVVSDKGWVYAGNDIPIGDVRVLNPRVAYHAVLEGNPDRGFVTLAPVALMGQGVESETHYFKRESSAGIVVQPVNVLVHPRPGELLEPLLEDLQTLSEVDDAQASVLVDGNLPDVLVALLNLGDTLSGDVA